MHASLGFAHYRVVCSLSFIVNAGVDTASHATFVTNYDYNLREIRTKQTLLSLYTHVQFSLLMIRLETFRLVYSTYIYIHATQ